MWDLHEQTKLPLLFSGEESWHRLSHSMILLIHRSSPIPPPTRPDRSRMGGRRGSSSRVFSQEVTRGIGPCDVPARRKTHFKPGRVLKEAMCEPLKAES